MVVGEVEGGLDDQLIDEAILGKKGERGNWEEEERFGSDEEEKAFGLGDNDEACPPRWYAPGVIIRQSGKPRPSVGDRDNDGLPPGRARERRQPAQTRVKLRPDNGAPCQNQMEITDRFVIFSIFFFYFLYGGSSAPLLCILYTRTYGLRNASPLSEASLKDSFHPGTRPSRWWRDRVRAATYCIPIRPPLSSCPTPQSQSCG
jgi:hypothetical protein